MGYWNIITPKATINYVKNPSFEVNVTDNWTAVSGSAARVSSFQKFGTYCAEVTASTGANFREDGALTAISTPLTATAWVYIPSSGQVDDLALHIYNTSTSKASKAADMDLTDQWQRLEVSFTADLSTTFRVHLISSSASGIFYVDAVQMERLTSATTYIDGSLDGGRWLGVPHQATTERAVTFLSGGEVTNFQNNLNYPIDRYRGVGYPRNILSTQPYSTEDGSRFQNQKFGERSFNLLGTVNDSVNSLVELHQVRQATIKRMLPTEDIETGEIPPKIIRYTGAETTKEIRGYFDNGLDLEVRNAWHEQDVPIQFIATDPNFYEVGNTAAILDVNDSQTFNGIAVRTNEGWEMPNSNPASIAGNSQVWSIAHSATDGKVYIAGDYTAWDGTFGDNYLVAGNVEDYSYSLVGSQAPDAIVWKAITGANDDVYIAGEFTSMGVANTDAIAVYNGSTWATIGGGAMSASGYVYDMAFKQNGNLIAVGTFTQIRGTAAKRIAEWDGSSWSEIGSGVDNGVIYGVSVAPNGDIYICGSFDSVGGSATFEGVARWDGTSWDNLNGGLDTVGRTLIVRDIQVTKDGAVYAGGDTTTANGATTAIGYISKYNGQVWEDLNGGVNGVVRRMLSLDSGELLLVGDFTAKAAGTAHNLPSMAIYTGTDFLPLDIDALTTPRGLAQIDGELWVGHGATSAVQTEGSTTISYAGTSKAYPVIEITRSGGTLAELRSIINEVTGKVLYFNSYQLLDGETITIDLTPDNFSYTSSLFGDIPRLLLASSDASDFYLASGNATGSYDNTLLCFAKLTGSPTITAVAKWRTAYISAD